MAAVAAPRVQGTEGVSLEGGQRQPEEGAWLTVGPRGKAMVQEEQQSIEEAIEEVEEQEVNRGGLGMRGLVRRLREGEQLKESTPKRRSNDVRVGDWVCKDKVCEWNNFGWRRECQKCQKNRQGVRAIENVTVGATEGVALNGRDLARRHPKLMILSINLLISGKAGQRPKLEDHVKIMKQAGLNLGEVRGKVAKNGYLEVALEPGAACAAEAIREGNKYVDERNTITSVREQGSNREAIVRWVEVPFTVQDETLYSYLELFSKPLRQGRNLWWEVYREEDDPGEGMLGVWNGERSLAVHLKPGVGHVPVWHYVGGTKMKLLVPGRRSCPRCMQAVGECKGGGTWNLCESSGMARGNWKEEQEKFLKRVGSSMEHQKALELELKDVEEGPENEEAEAEMKIEAERMEAAAEQKEGLMLKVPMGKICGGIHLKNFPQGTGDKKREKREALLTVIAACHDLSQVEQDRLGEADVTVTKAEKGKKGTLDVKIRLDSADELMRKVWSQLRRACKEEGVKSYQIEASTPASPIKEKPKTELQKARLRVAELLKEEDDQLDREQTKKNQTEAELHENSIEVHNEISGDEKIDPMNPTEPEVLKTKADQRVEDSKTIKTKNAAVKTPADELESKRIKEQRWVPPEGKRRCGGQCQGCQKKCEDQGVDDCHNCHLNKTKGGRNGCCNRGECTNLKTATVKGNKKAAGKSSILGDNIIGDLLEKSPSATSKVGSQLVTFHPGQVESLAKDLESKGKEEKEKDSQEDGKRRRPEGDTPPDQKRSSKMPTMRKEGLGSMLQLPGKSSSLTN